MEDSTTLYNSFTKLAVKFAISQGNTLEEAKNAVKKQFKNHPYFSIISDAIKTYQKDATSLKNQLKECLLICEEFGPNREYVTLLFILKNLQQKENNSTKGNTFIKKFNKEIHRINKKIPAPPLFNRVLETRSIVEWISMIGIYPFIPKRKKGNNNPVILIPPYLGNDISTSFVRKYLNSLEFKAYKWNLGANMIRPSYIPILEDKLDEIFEKHQEKVSIVGWSGGGIFAKILANRHPDKISQIITIGSPIWGLLELKTSINSLFDFLRGKSLKERNKRFLGELEAIPEVPITCIYTKTDGIVPWKNCMEAETYRKDIKNIEVYGSHSGLGANATVLLTVANTLSAHIKGNEVKVLSKNIESVLFPKFWRKKGSKKIFNLLFGF